MKRALTKREWFFALVLLLVFAVVLFRTAWMSDDAYITLRTVDNFINGYGLRWNIIERTQSYTSPLWLFVISFFYLFTKEAYYTVIFLSIFFSLITVSFLLFRISITLKSGLLAVVLLLFSKAFIDYSTSGLENVFAHFLFVVFYYYYYIYQKEDDGAKRLFIITFLASFIVLNRMDHILFVFPILFYEVFLNNFQWKNIGIAVAGFFPFIVWEIFSIIYYGFPFPNTAYAKLNSGIGGYRLFQQGLLYLLDIVLNDPIGAITIVVALVLLLVSWKKDIKQRLLFLGMLLYLFYIVKIGGDFMSGRFFSVMILLSAITISRFRLTSRIAFFGIVPIVFIGLFIPFNPVLSGKGYLNRKIPTSGIADERGYYFAYTGLFNGKKGAKPIDPFRNKGKREKNFVVKDGVGMSGFALGPKKYILDRYALSDAFLARVPFQQQWEHRGFRPGHLGRIFPEGYEKTLKTGKNHLRDDRLAKVYTALTLITRGEIFSLSRFVEIVKMNSGFYSHYIRDYTHTMELYADTMRSDYKVASVNILRKTHSDSLFRCGQPSLRKDGFLLFGPYVSMKRGCYKITYSAGITPTGRARAHNEILNLDVFASGQHLAERKIFQKDFKKADVFQKFSLYINLETETKNVEFRAFYKPSQKVCLDTIRVEIVDDSVCASKIEQKGYFEESLFLYFQNEKKNISRPQHSFMLSDDFSLVIDREKALKQLPLRIVWTNPRGKKDEVIVDSLSSKEKLIARSPRKKERGKWIVSLFSADKKLFEKRSFMVLGEGEFQKPLITMHMTNEKVTDIRTTFSADEKISVNCKWKHRLRGKRVILDWINPQGDVAFSSYHHANFRRNQFSLYPYRGPLPMMEGEWRVNVRIITFDKKSEDLLLGETSFTVSDALLEQKQH
ncbi:hypothetical protein KAH37_00110 [bacterium]|nr:hypothetical protein [bacterium]